LNSLPENPEAAPELAGRPAPELAPSEPLAPSPPPDPAWNGWDIARIFLMGMVAIFVTTLVLSLIVPGATFRQRANYLNARPELLIMGQMVAYLALFAYMYILVAKERRQPHFWKAVHWNWPAHIWVFLFWGVLMQATFLVIERFLPFPKEVPFEALFRRPYSVVLVAVFSTTLGPFMEEMFFRGFLYPVLKRRTGVMTAIVATALPFALMHAAQYGNSWASVMLIFMVGVVLAMVREKKNSLAAAFLVHVAYNGTIVLLMFIATGGFRHLEKLSQ
jgi:membrane protease YdiL (CAAX protease family)